MKTYGTLGLALMTVALLALVGCNKPNRHPVQGKVVLEDGTPLAKGLVVFESPDGDHMARGTIQGDGTFVLGTGKPGDGVKPGRYRVLVSALDMADVPDEEKVLPFDVKYTRHETSGLVVEVKSEPNQVTLKLERPAPVVKDKDEKGDKK